MKNKESQDEFKNRPSTKRITSRREFFKESILLITATTFASRLFTSCEDDHDGNSGATSPENFKYVPIKSDNPSIVRIEDNCEYCEECVEICKDTVTVFGTYDPSKTHVCIHCGSCIGECEYGALTQKYDYDKVLTEIQSGKTVIVSTAPSVRVGIGDYFGLPAGTFAENQMVGALRSLGFSYVLDVNFGADLTIMEEAAEFTERVTNNTLLPQFTSCCPAWVKFAEIYYPDLLPHLSTARSPIGMQGAMVKSYFAANKGISPSNIVHVMVAPCTAKKYEILREEMTTNGLRSTDYVLTTSELAKLMKQQGVSLSSTGTYDTLMGEASGGGIIFGKTGGVMMAALRTAYYNITGTNPPSNLIDLQGVDGLNNLKEATVSIAGKSVNIAVCYDMKKARELLTQVRAGNCKYHFIEVMNCRGGCVGGAGQPASKSTIQARIDALTTADKNSPIRLCHDNPEIKAIYANYLGTPLGSKSKEYLHTRYTSKAHLLNS